MRVSYNWLKDYVDFDLSPSELADKLTMAGFEVEEIITKLPEFKDIIVGEVVSCGKHPDADKLSICKVKIPDDTLKVICGAPNVAEGQKIAFAQELDNLTLPQAFALQQIVNKIITKELNPKANQEHASLSCLLPQRIQETLVLLVTNSCRKRKAIS